MKIHTGTAAAVVAAALALTAGPVAAAPDAKPVIESYADMALAKYTDSLDTARALRAAIAGFLDKPGQEGLTSAKRAWRAARVPYQQSEVYRFANPIVDDWEGQVNAWPLDEGLIDYVDASYGAESEANVFYRANVIANPSLAIGGTTLDARSIDKNLIRSLHEIDKVEANVSTGYHAIEFLLWGQDLNGTGPGAGARPWTDFATGAACTGGHCDRRRAYLVTAVDLLVDDLKDMVGQWTPDGAARAALVSATPGRGLAAILTGMGSLSYGELAGERMKLGLLLHDPEEEHDCFSDNTHNSHYYDALGIRSVYLGTYQRSDGKLFEGPALTHLVKAKSPELDAEMRKKLDATLSAMTAIKASADSGRMAYDQMIGEGNEAGNAMVQTAIDALLDQTKTIEKIVAALDLGYLQFEGSESLDEPKAVFQ